MNDPQPYDPAPPAPTHTHGPWKASGISVRHPSFPKPYAVIETADGAHRIANIQSNLSDEQCLINARLIAASPDLLEACEMLMEAMNDEGQCDCDALDITYMKARSAIQKARGP
jgi:hypothetical protein